MVQVCDRQKTKEEMLEQAITQYKDMFIRARQGFGKVVDVSDIGRCRRLSAN